VSNEIALKAQMQKLSAEIESTVNDSELTIAQKSEKVGKLREDAINVSKMITDIAASKGLFAGTGAATPSPEAQATAERADQGRVEAKSLGAQFVSSDVYKKGALAVDNNLKLEGVSMITKAFNDGTYDGTQNVSNFNGTAGPFYYPHLVPGIVGINQMPLNVEAFLPSGATDSPVVSYIIEASWTNAADMVLEAGTKPTMTVETFQRVNEPVTKVAQIYKMTDEMMLDASQVKSWIDARLLYGLNRKVQDQLLNGNGTLPQLRGLNLRSGFETTVVSASLGGDSGAWATAILAQITAIRNVGFTEPNAILVNPLDWAVIQDLKDANGQYLNGGPWGRSYGNNAPNVTSFWGLPLVATLSQPQGTALVGNFSDAQVWNRQGVTVEMTNSDGTDFQNDIVTVRAERRLGLALYRPLSFGKVTLTA